MSGEGNEMVDSGWKQFKARIGCLFVRRWKEKDPQGVLPADKEATMRRKRKRRRRRRRRTRRRRTRRTDSSSTASGENGGGSGARAVEVVREAAPGARNRATEKETRKRKVGALAGTHRG
jgi:hypothetical protein